MGCLCRKHSQGYPARAFDTFTLGLPYRAYIPRYLYTLGRYLREQLILTKPYQLNLFVAGLREFKKDPPSLL